MIGLIWAQARDGVIGRAGRMPWHLPEDLAHFRAVTAGATVVMGRTTWDSIPARFRPLPGRRNVVVTRNRSWSAPGAEVAHSIDAALAASPTVWVVGGAEVYAATLDRADVLEVTELDLAVDGDAFAPPVPEGWAAADAPWRTSRDGIRHRFLTYCRRPIAAGEAVAR